MRERAKWDGGPSTAEPKGTALIITVLIVSLLLVLGLALLSLSSSDYQVGINGSRSIQALYNADAGMEEAKMRLSPNAPAAPTAITIGASSNWRGYILSGYQDVDISKLDPTYGYAPPSYTASESPTSYTYTPSVQTGANTIKWGWARIQYKFDQTSGNPVYLDVVTGQETGNASQVVSGSTFSNPPILVVTAEGIQPSIPSPVTRESILGSVRRMIRMELRPIIGTTFPFSNAVHGRNNVTLNGNAYTDSYDSRNGAYSVATNRSANGDVSSDATANGTVGLVGGAVVNGSVLIGPGGDPSTAISAGSTAITGSRGTESAVWGADLVSIPAGVSNQGPLSLKGNQVMTLSEGTYWFSSIDIQGNGLLQTTGKVKIYVTGPINIQGNGFAAASNLPPNLLVYGTTSTPGPPATCAPATCCTSVNIGGNGTTYAAIYAPMAAITVNGNGDIYGSLAGQTVNLVGGGTRGGFHYDQALGQTGGITSVTGYTRYSWTEIPF